MIGLHGDAFYFIFDGLTFTSVESIPKDDITEVGEVVYDEGIDFFISPFNLDTNELALFSTEDCNIDCEYCHYKYFKQKLMGEDSLDCSYKLDEARQYIKATMPDLIEFIGGEHSLVFDKIIAIDKMCQELGAPDSLIIELDTNGTLYSNLLEIAANTKHVHFIFSYESSDTGTNKRGLNTKDSLNSIIRFNKQYPERTSVRYLFLHGQSSIRVDLDLLHSEKVYVKEAYQICDVKDCLGVQTEEDVLGIIEGPLGALYYKAFASYESELYGMVGLVLIL
jgi:uncharacterized Fe-S cluster-containing radical SAM superfamily protein